MITFVYNRGLGPVSNENTAAHRAPHRAGGILNAFNNLLGLNMQLLTRNRGLIQTLDHTRDPLLLHTDPVPREDYLQQWDTMVGGGQRGLRGRRQGDGRERGSRPKKGQTAGFEFRT